MALVRASAMCAISEAEAAEARWRSTKLPIEGKAMPAQIAITATQVANSIRVNPALRRSMARLPMNWGQCSPMRGCGPSGGS